MSSRGNIVVWFLITVGGVLGFGLIIGTMAVREMKVSKAFLEYNYLPYLSQSAADFAAARIHSEVSNAEQEYFLQLNTEGECVEFAAFTENIPSQSLIVMDQPFSEEIKQNHSIEIHFSKKESQVIEAQVNVVLDQRHIQKKLLLQLPQQPTEPVTVLK